MDQDNNTLVIPRDKCGDNKFFVNTLKDALHLASPTSPTKVLCEKTGIKMVIYPETSIIEISNNYEAMKERNINNGNPDGKAPHPQVIDGNIPNKFLGSRGLGVSYIIHTPDITSKKLTKTKGPSMQLQQDKEYFDKLHKAPTTLPSNSDELAYSPPGEKITKENAGECVAKCMEMSHKYGQPVLLTDTHNEIGKVIIAPGNAEENKSYHAKVTKELLDELPKQPLNGKGTQAQIRSAATEHKHAL